MNLPKAISLLKIISGEIDDFFNTTSQITVARSTDVYDFARRNKAIRKEFPTAALFGHFLKTMHQQGILRQIIGNCNVDVSNPKFYQWRFYRKETKPSTEQYSESVTPTAKYFKSGRNIATNDGAAVRSYQEQYIYNRLLEEDGLKFYYERPFDIKGYNKIPDFTILVYQSKTVYHWEHFGMIEDPNYELYAEKKIQWYFDNGYRFLENGGRFIVTYYRSDTAFKDDVDRILKLIKAC